KAEVCHSIIPQRAVDLPGSGRAATASAARAETTRRLSPTPRLSKMPPQEAEDRLKSRADHRLVHPPVKAVSAAGNREQLVLDAGTRQRIRHQHRLLVGHVRV